MRRTLVAAALSASLLAAPGGQPGLFDSFWRLLASFWGHSLTKEGCGMDPDGRCTTAPQPTSDEGCGMGPSGCPAGGS